MKYDSDIPGRSVVSHCSHMHGDEKCGKEAHNTFRATVEIYGKEINVTKMLCDDCYTELGLNDVSHYSIGENS